MTQLWCQFQHFFRSADRGISSLRVLSLKDRKDDTEKDDGERIGTISAFLRTLDLTRIAVPANRGDLRRISAPVNNFDPRVSRQNLDALSASSLCGSLRSLHLCVKKRRAKGKCAPKAGQGRSRVDET